MNIPLMVVAGRSNLHGECAYFKKDFSLLFENKVSPSQAKIEKNLREKIDFYLRLDKEVKLFMHFDTLTLVFSGETKFFESLDSYVNLDKCSNSIIALPDSPLDLGILKIACTFEDSHFSTKVNPEYTQDFKNKVVRIVLNKKSADKFWLIAENVIAGTCKGFIVEMLLINLKFI